MKLVPWLLLLHMVALAIASGIAIATDRDGDKFLALGMMLMITGWASMGSAACSLIFSAVRSSLSTKEVVVLVFLFLMGLHEKNVGAEWYTYIRSLPV